MTPRKKKSELQKFDVVVTRDVTESCVIAVYAKDEKQAEELALAESNSGQFSWDVDDSSNVNDHYVTCVEEIN